MTSDDATITTDAPITRAETRVPGGVVITVVTLKGTRFRARNLMGVVLRDDLSVVEWGSFADAEAALGRFATCEPPPPRKVDRCRHCRGNHGSDTCPVHAEAERRRAELRAALAAKATRASEDCPAIGSRKGATRNMNAPTNARAEASNPRLVRTLDDYCDALGIAAYRGPVVLSQVVTTVHGREATRAQRDETERALDELVAQGRAERNSAGRYELVRSAAEPEPEPPPDSAGERPSAYKCWHDSPHGDGSDDPCEFDAAEPASPHCAGCICAPEPETSAPGSEDDDGTTAPSAPDSVVHAKAGVSVRRCPVVASDARDNSDDSLTARVNRAAGNVLAELLSARPLSEPPEIVQPVLPVPAEVLETIDDVAARHAPRPELDSVEAVLEEANALRRRTEVALAVALSDVEEANSREAAARAEHEAAFRAAKAKSDRLRQVQQLATRLGVETGAPA